MSESENSNPSKKARSNRASSADQTKDDEAIFKIADWGMEKHFLIHSGKRAADAVEGWPRLIARDNDTRALSKLHLLASEVVKSRGDQFEVVESPSLKLAYYYSPNTLGFVSDKPLPKTWKLDRTPLGQKVLDALRVDYHALQAQYPMHRMSAIYEVFVKITNALPLFVSEAFVDVHNSERLDTEPAMRFIASKLNVVFDCLRVRWRSVSEEYANFCRSPIENYNGFMDDIDGLCASKKQLVVLHLDVHEEPASDAGKDQADLLQPAPALTADLSQALLASGGTPVPLKELSDRESIVRLNAMQKARTEFQKEINRRFKKRLLGYGWCLEFGTRRAWHYHYLIFLKPSGKDEDDIALVDELGATWLDLKPGGDYHNVNASKGDYKYLAAGLVDTSDADVLQGLKFKAGYMTLAGLYVQTLLPAASRSFGRGGFEKAPKPPRSTWRQLATWQAVRRRFTWI